MLSIAGNISRSKSPRLSLAASFSLSDQIISDLDRGITPTNLLPNSPIYLSPSVILEVLYKCSSRSPLLGQTFVDLLAKRSDLRLSSESLSAMIHISVLNRRSVDAQSLILRMVRRGGTSRSEIVDALISTYHGCKSIPSVFDLVIRTYVQARKLREATEVFHILKGRSVSVSVNACNSLLSGLVRVGWLAMVWNLYREVLVIGTCLNAYTLNIIVNALCRDGRFDEVDEFMDEMERKGKGFMPAVVTYNAVLNGFCQTGNYEKAKEMKLEMVRSGLTPNISTFNILLGAFCREGEEQEAIGIYHEILQQGLAPDIVTFSNLISLFTKKGDINPTLMYFKEMKVVGLIPDTFIYTMLIHGYCSNES